MPLLYKEYILALNLVVYIFKVLVLYTLPSNLSLYYLKDIYLFLLNSF